MKNYIEAAVSCLRTFLYSIQTRKDAKWLKARRAQVISALQSSGSSIEEQSFIEGGTYHWKYADGPIDIDFFFPYVPLAVKIASRVSTPYDQVEKPAPSHRFWEAKNAEDAFVVEVCRRAEVPVLLIGPFDPVDPYNLAAGARAAMGNK